MANNIESLRMFLAAANSLNFREAAARCQVSPQVITRSIQALEIRLGEVLFHRSTRSVQLSDFGRYFTVQAEYAVSQVNALFQTDEDIASDALQGSVRVAAPTIHGRRFVMPVLSRLAHLHPTLCFDLRLSDQMIDPVQDRIDVGLQGGRILDNRFVARPVAAVSQHICIAPSLLKRLGPVRSVRELDRMPTTQLINRSTGRAWPWALSQGREFVPTKWSFVTDDPVAECDAVLAGLGIGQLSATLAADHLKKGSLLELMPQAKSKLWPLTVYMVRRQPVPARIRLTFDALVQALKVV
jgi:DNA-binding transcriptional LysR family regulator